MAYPGYPVRVIRDRKENNQTHNFLEEYEPGSCLDHSPAWLRPEPGTQGPAASIQDAVETRALVKRNVSLEDKRSVQIELTPQGTKLVETLIPQPHASAGEWSSAFSHEERMLLTEILQRLIAHQPQRQDGS